MSYVLGLDLSLTSTGRATVPNPADGTPTTRVIGSDAAGDAYPDRWVRLVTMTDRILWPSDEHPLTEAIDPAHEPDLVVVEGPSYGSSAQKSASIHDRAGLWWHLVGTLYDRGTPVAVVAPTTRAKWATGRGNAGKSEVAVAVARLWPHHDARTDDEWDALALATMGAQWLQWDGIPSRAHQALTLAAVTWPQTREPATPPHPAQAG